MTPKIIHYCWFGHNPLPPLAEKCIASWRKFLPDYEIKEWNEENFDVNIIPYTSEAYKAKKYAFVSDYARFWILYKYGGLYFDTDVEVIRPLDDILERGAFMGCENAVSTNKETTLAVAPGLGLGVSPHHDLYNELLEYYSELHFKDSTEDLNNQQTIVHHTTEVLRRHGLQEINAIQKVANVYIYPCEYFCPINIVTKRLHITKNTRTIHHYMASWNKSSQRRLKNIIRGILPESWLIYYNSIKIRK